MNRGRGRGRGGRGGGTASRSSPTPVPKGATPSLISTNATPGTAPTDVVRPVLPPLYPAAPKVPASKKCADGFANQYLDIQEFYRSNYTIEFLKKKRCGFNVERYTDKYNQPHSMDPKHTVKVDQSRLPKELYVKNIKILRKKQMTDLDAKRKLEELFQLDKEDAAETEGSKRKRRKIEEETKDEFAIVEATETIDLDNDEEEEVDEELDEGTDYMANYFDNGEDYLDEEDDALEDGAVF